MSRTSVLILVALGALGCTGGGDAGSASHVTGTVTYRERMVLPDDAVVEVTLQDVSKADAPAEVLGSVRVRNPGTPPIRFRVPYDKAKIDARHRYSVRARILVGSDLLFTSDQAHPVLTQGHGNTVDVPVRRASGADAASATLSGLPASFVGDLPCADCQGMRYHLNLFPDNVYFLRLTSLGRGQDASLDDIGTWSVEAGKLTLRGGREAPIQFSIEDERTLRQLDTQGRAIQSSLPHDLMRAGALQTLEPHLQLRGMYTYMADAGLFRECLTAKRWPVAMEAANASLERAYAEARGKPGDEVLAGVEGRIAMRPKMEGEGLQATLVVERVIGVWPGQQCPPRAGNGPALENTPWKLTEMLGVAVQAADPQRTPQVVLQSADRRVVGNGGCNRLSGSYTLDGTSLRFGAIVTTKMACPDMATESAFLKALAGVATWKIANGTLELSDAQGAVLLRFAPQPAG